MISILIPTTPDRRERIKETIKSINENTKNIPYVIVVYENEYIGWANAVRNMIENINGLVVLLESDVTVTEGWLDKLIEARQKGLETGIPEKNIVLEPYNELHQGTLIQHPFCDVSILNEYISRDYFHSYADNELNDRIKENCTFIYVPKAKINHLHFTKGRSEKDKGYEVATDPDKVNLDRNTYSIRKANNWLK